MNKNNEKYLPPIYLGHEPLATARREALLRLATAGGHTWSDAPSIGKLVIGLADENRQPMAYYCTGGKGSVIQLEDGRFSDTVSGCTSEYEEPHEALAILEKKAEELEVEWQAIPLYGKFDQATMLGYCGYQASC